VSGVHGLAFRRSRHTSYQSKIHSGTYKTANTKVGYFPAFFTYKTASIKVGYFPAFFTYKTASIKVVFGAVATTVYPSCVF
jgi:hypothetical protein